MRYLISITIFVLFFTTTYEQRKKYDASMRPFECESCTVTFKVTYDGRGLPNTGVIKGRITSPTKEMFDAVMVNFKIYTPDGDELTAATAQVKKLGPGETDAFRVNLWNTKAQIGKIKYVDAEVFPD